MKSASILLAVTLALLPVTSFAGPRGGGGGRSAPSSGRGFDMGSDAPGKGGGSANKSASNTKNAGNGSAYNKNSSNGSSYNKNGTTATTNNHNSGAYNSANTAAAYNKNTGNAAVYNKSTGNMSVYNKNTGTTSTYHYNNNGTNGYYYNGRVVVNPVYVGPAWGWNRGIAWAPVGAYWGGGFWGPFAVGAATAAAMGTFVYANQTYTSYQINAGSPGATLLSNYGLRQVPCGAPGLVVIYGPNFGIACASPNARVAAGNYAVNVNTLSLQSQ